MNFKKLNAIWKDDDLSAQEKLLLIRLLDNKDNEARHGLESLSKDTGIHPSTISKATTSLAKRGKLLKRRTLGANRYVVLPEMDNPTWRETKPGLGERPNPDLARDQTELGEGPNPSLYRESTKRINNNESPNSITDKLLEAFSKNPSLQATIDGNPVVYDKAADEFLIDLGPYRVFIPPPDHSQIQIH